MTNSFSEFSQRIRRDDESVSHEEVSMADKVTLSGAHATDSCFAVSRFAQWSIATAVAEGLQLRQQLWGASGTASVDRQLAVAWCEQSFQPQGWVAPASWDEFAGDYRTTDGWIRLHTNAAHHREAALRVLGNPLKLDHAREAVSGWSKADLESAVIAEGGAAACMLTEQQWRTHAQGRAVATEPLVAWTDTDDAQRPKGVFDAADALRPLKGIRVLDLTRVIAGPVCTRFLASLGADVLRIDPPHWDEGGNVLEMTLGKRCAGLDLSDKHDRQQFETLVKQAHVLVHGYRADALDTLGLGFERRRQINPGLIDIALNAYGWTGPWRNRRGFDSLVQMSSGIADRGRTQASSDTPVPLPFQALDHVTGYLMAASALRALKEQVRTGRTLSARLSLARQACLLQDEFGVADVINSDSEIHAGRPLVCSLPERAFATEREVSSWGVLKRLRLPYVIDGVTTGFSTPVSALRSVPAQWASD